MTPFIPLWLVQLQLSNNRNIIILIWCGQYSSGSILNCPSPLTFRRNGQSIIEDEPPNNAIKCMRYKLKFSSLPLSIEYTQRKKGTVNVLHALPFDNEPFFWSNERKKKQYEPTSFESMPAVASLLSLSLFLFWAIMICKKKEIIDQRMSAAFDYHLFTQMDDNDTAFQFQLNNILPNALNTLRFSVQYSYSDVHLRSYSLAIVNG